MPLYCQKGAQNVETCNVKTCANNVVQIGSLRIIFCHVINASLHECA